jgi:hypothetical protein
VNACWGIGQLIAVGMLKGLLTRTDQWGWRIPYAVQVSAPATLDTVGRLTVRSGYGLCPCFLSLSSLPSRPGGSSARAEWTRRSATYEGSPLARMDQTSISNRPSP